MPPMRIIARQDDGSSTSTWNSPLLLSPDSSTISTWNSPLLLSRNTFIIVGVVACIGFLAVLWKILDCLGAREVWRLSSGSRDGEMERGTQQPRREVEGSEALSREDIEEAMREMEIEAGRGNGGERGESDLRGERRDGEVEDVDGDLDSMKCGGCREMTSADPTLRATCRKCDEDIKSQAIGHQDSKPKRSSRITDHVLLLSTPTKTLDEPGSENSGGSGNVSEGAGTPETVIHVGPPSPPLNQEQDHNKLKAFDANPPLNQQPSPSQIGVAISGSPYPRVRADSVGRLEPSGGIGGANTEYDPYRPRALSISKTKSKPTPNNLSSDEAKTVSAIQFRKGSKSASEGSCTGRLETQIPRPRPRTRVLSQDSVFPDPDVVFGSRRGSKGRSESESSSAESLKTQIGGWNGL